MRWETIFLHIEGISVANTFKYQNLKLEIWAGVKGGLVKDGRIHFKGQHPPIFLVHWAGQCRPDSFDNIIYSLLKLSGFKKTSDLPGIRFFMPYKKLWKHYRSLGF